MIKLSPLALQFILCGLLGFLAEVVFTALTDPIKNKRFTLKGSTHLWVFPVYGLMIFVYPPLREYVARYDWYIRGAVYMLAFFVVQYVSGWILHKMVREKIWEYNSKMNLNGYIQLGSAPIWFLAGLGFERIYPYLIRLSKLIAA